MDELVRDVHVERYYPQVIAPAKEFKAIAEVVNPELTLIWKRLWQLFCNTFVYDIDEAGATRWEIMLKLRPKATDDLITRRRRILTKINAQLPYTHRQLENMLAATYGAGKTKVSINYNDYALWVDILASILTRTPEMRTFLRAIVPANMTIGISNTQTLNQSIYAGGYIRVSKRVEIHPSLSFGSAEMENNLGAIGFIRKVAHTVIRS
ncbi:hypothetical protein P22_1954 [Propionispora sp. 2/2-37]|uniref:putative phage tail protein n=1 Tax=Propionispora sp. 2/2-37 TaxID=1677858 RepID=UPI0006BB9472|nr:putative phage tail protein [Propionispora sp. 2/2-37]CUH95868.1 hypothetical protein P22_1954 [Propionispora sp. 2/2-37]